MSTAEYMVTARREGDWWALEANLGHRTVASQCRSLSQVERVMSEAIAIALDLDDQQEADLCLDVRPRLADDKLTDATLRARSLRAQQAQLEADLARETAEAVAALRGSGLTTRDVGALLGITAARVSQIQTG